MSAETLNTGSEDGEAIFIGSVTGAAAWCHRGYNLYTGHDYVFEPDVFYIDEIDVSDAKRGSGLGKQVMRVCLERARQEHCSLVRMGVINPAVINIVETMKSEGLAKGVGYIPSRSHILETDIPSAEVLISPNRVNKDYAIEFLEAMNAAYDHALATGQDEQPYTLGVTTVMQL